MLSFPNYIGFKVKELLILMVSPLSDHESVRLGTGQLIILANPRVITSANIQNGFGGNEEDEKHVLYQVYQ